MSKTLGRNSNSDGGSPTHLRNLMDKAVRRHDAALDRWWPDKKNANYHEELLAVVADLEVVIAQSEKEGFSPLEHSRAARWLGDALADLASEERVSSGKNLIYLSRAITRYQLAESILASVDEPLDRAKLNFNFANTLRRIDIENITLLEAAQRRYQVALELFNKYDPSLAPRVTGPLESVAVLLQCAPLAKLIKKKDKEIDNLGTLLENEASGSEISAQMNKVLENGDPHDLAQRVKDLVENLPKSIRDQDNYDALNKRMKHILLLSGYGDDSPEVKQDREVLGTLNEMLEREVQSGRVSPERVGAIEDALDTINSTINLVGDDTATLRKKMLELRHGGESLIPAMRDMSYGLPAPPQGTRAAHARNFFWNVREFVLREIIKGGQPREVKLKLYQLTKSLTKVDRRLVDASSNNNAALTAEAESARPKTVEVHRVASMLRPYLARPIWPGAPSQIDPNAIFYSGGPELRQTLSGLCADRRLNLLGEPRHVEYANSRWKQISSAKAAIFDLGASINTELAAVAYELGIARTLGIPIIVLAPQTMDIPFDIDVPTIRTPDDLEVPELGEGLDRVVYSIPEIGTESSVAATISDTIRRFEDCESFEVVQTLKDLKAMLPDPDPIAARHALEALVSFLGPTGPALITPPWPVVYPASTGKRMFHVMPFGPDWANDTAMVAEASCDKGRRAVYVRGDRVIKRQIIHSIWEEICRATHILVDLSDFNPNVAFELGIADTLGSETLLVAQESSIKGLFPMIAKSRVTTYHREDLSSTLAPKISNWLQRQ